MSLQVVEQKYKNIFPLLRRRVLDLSSYSTHLVSTPSLHIQQKKCPIQKLTVRHSEIALQRGDGGETPRGGAKGFEQDSGGQPGQLGAIR
jgi:hypothetical protein